MADDLDDFFNEVEEAAAKVVEVDDEVNEPPSKKQKSQDNQTDSIKDADKAAEQEEPKKAKTPAPIRPRGVVVAASSSVALTKPKREEDDSLLVEKSIHNQPIPPPPPPPPPQQPNISTIPTQQPSKPKKPVKRMAAGKVWEDPTLVEWPENDFRIFCGNLDATTTDAQLKEHFQKYPSIAMAKVVKDANGNGKGFGFVSFLSPLCCAKAIREMDQTWLGSRPIRIKRSDWKDRNANQVKKQEKRRKKRGF